MSANKRVKRELEMAVSREIGAFIAKKVPTRLSMTNNDDGKTYAAWEIPGLLYDEKESYVVGNGKVYIYFENIGFVRTSFWLVTFTQPLDRSGYYACGTKPETDVPLSTKDWRKLLSNLKDMNEQATV
jgi:hypothetical protein